MKGLNLGVVVTAFFALISSACGGYEPQQEQVAVVAVETARPMPTISPIDSAVEAAHAAEARRAELIEEIKLAFGLTPDPNAWVSEVRGGEGPFVALCRQQVRVSRMSSALNKLESDPSLAEAIPGSPDYNGELRKAQLGLAQTILALFKFSREARRQAEPCREMGEGQIAYWDGLQAMDRLIELLKKAGAEPNDIGAAPAGLRQILLKDLRAWVQETRKEVAAGEAGESDAYWFLIDAVDEWKFTPEELGLTTEEAKLLQRGG